VVLFLAILAGVVRSVATNYSINKVRGVLRFLQVLLSLPLACHGGEGRRFYGDV
jgi:hypothetical protein